MPSCSPRALQATWACRVLAVLRQLCLQCVCACSNALDTWEVMLCMPRTLEKVLKEVTKGSQLSRLVEGVTEDTCILFLAVS